MALAMAVMNSANAWTIERMFFGALVNAYSSDVMEARISEMAIRMYEPLCTQMLMVAAVQSEPSA